MAAPDNHGSNSPAPIHRKTWTGKRFCLTSSQPENRKALLHSNTVNLRLASIERSHPLCKKFVFGPVDK